ncbi:hypothetical protein HMPREF0346_2718, partial [Enterococcus faecalis EnGen0297]
NLTKFQKWFIRKGERFDYYMDYLHMLEELNTPLNNDSVLYPENLQVAHDNAMNTLNLLKNEIEEKQYQERKNQIKALEAEIDDLLFLTPHSLQEIIQEGKYSTPLCGQSTLYRTAYARKNNDCFYPKKRKARYALLHIRISKSTGYTNTRKM